MPEVRVHRFHQYVGISLQGDGGTEYLSAEEAHLLANALKRCAVDIEVLPFSQSQVSDESVFIATHSRAHNKGRAK